MIIKIIILGHDHVIKEQNTGQEPSREGVKRYARQFGKRRDTWSPCMGPASPIVTRKVSASLSVGCVVDGGAMGTASYRSPIVIRNCHNGQSDQYDKTTNKAYRENLSKTCFIT